MLGSSLASVCGYWAFICVQGVTRKSHRRIHWDLANTQASSLVPEVLSCKSLEAWEKFLGNCLALLFCLCMSLAIVQHKTVIGECRLIGSGRPCVLICTAVNAYKSLSGKTAQYFYLYAINIYPLCLTYLTIMKLNLSVLGLSRNSFLSHAEISEVPRGCES